MKSLDGNKIVGLPVIQNKQEFILGVFTIDQILKFTRYTERLIVNYDEDNKPIYNKQIQRAVEPGRVQKIADFLINDPNATFPTNIVLSIPQAVIERQNQNKNFVEIYLDEKVFEGISSENGDVHVTVIDGQHRISGIEVAIARLKTDIRTAEQTIRSERSETMEKRLGKFKERLDDLLRIELVVSFFIDKTLEYQAMIFSTINRTQKRVSRNLVYSLFGLNSDDSPQKTALQVVLAHNGLKTSPFYKRIKLHGGDYDKNQSPPLSQATMVKSIVDLICENLRESENDRFRERDELHIRSESSGRVLPFRKYYANNNDKAIATILFYYYGAVQQTFKDDLGNSYWDFPEESTKQSNILQTTVGYEALLKILVDILSESKLERIDAAAPYEEYLAKCELIDFTDQKRFPFANKSKNILYLDMSLHIWPHDPVNLKDKRKEKLDELLKENKL